MLAAIRGFAKSPFAVLLMGLLIVSFAVWGVRDAFKSNIANWVIKAGSHEVSAEDYKTIFDREVRTAEERMGRAITPEEAAAHGVDRQILSGMADSKAVAELISRMGVQSDDRLLATELARNPNFADPLTGRFDARTYRQVLANNQVPATSFESELRDEIAEKQFTSGLGAGTKVPLVYSAMVQAYMLEGRGADYMLLTEHSVPMPAKPTDAQLTAYMQQNAAALKQPEFRTISLVRFSAAAIQASEPADPAAVQKAFEAVKGRLNTPERRAFVQVMFKDPGQAAAAAARLGKGEEPAAVAKAYGAGLTPYPATSQQAIPDPKIASAVFALQPGQVSAPVVTGFGVAVVKLTSITPAKTATLEDARPQIEADVKAKAAQQKVYDQFQKYNDAHDSGAPLVKAAQAAGVKVYTLGPLTAQGVERATHQKDPALTAKMLAQAFSLPAGGETEVEQLGKGEYYALRVDAITPSALPKLDEARAPLTNRYIIEELIKRLQARANALSDQLNKGQPIDKVAASAGLTVEHVKDITRATAAQHKELGEEFLGKLFAAKPGGVFIARSGVGIAVGKATPVTGASTGQLAIAAVRSRGQITEMMMNDLGESLRNIARDRVKPKLNIAKARQAIGLPALPDSASAAASSAKAK